ncbi:restriction endonuclease subunit S [Allokutzneria albata]|uniref:Type I restriction modification DNA specificity domain-containing protein n=1 Tax=Allokutzneria albata TaxID=211114 RepID=A0A1G9Y9J0_ALLAB|nr:restriction endonuclease subunit S [Allokutzneria albata]SDN05083.1 Type I restriction modification DNA specificity domain-containing protein [Allokutzneria albata]
MSEWDEATLGELIALDVNAVEVDPTRAYNIVGVLNRGRGLLYREPMAGSETAYKALNRIGPNQIVYSRLKAFEGAITVAPVDLHEVYASQEFPTFTCGASLLPGYFRLLTTTKHLWDTLQNLSTGMGGRRERVKPNDFLTITIPLPSLAEQRRIIDTMGAVDAQIEALADESKHAWKLHTSTRETLLAKAPLTPLDDLCSLRVGLVDPRLDEHIDLIHVGVDALEKNTGRIVGARTAREDGLISGKYLFEAGDVIYSKIRPMLRKVGLPGFRGLCSADAYPLRPHDGVPASLLREALLFEPVVEQAVKMSGRTKMPKVNRKELFSIRVPMPVAADRSMVDASLLSLRSWAESLDSEINDLRAFRSTLLSSLLNQEIEIPESYDDLLAKVS